MKDIRWIFLMGMDGAGKSTIAGLLADEMSRRGIHVSLVHYVNPYWVTLFGRKVGFLRLADLVGRRVLGPEGIGEFRRFHLLMPVIFLCGLLDIIASNKRSERAFRNRVEYVICDRTALDLVVLAASTARGIALAYRVLHAFLPPNAFYATLRANRETIRRRRPEMSEEEVATLSSAYMALASVVGSRILETDGSPEIVLRALVEGIFASPSANIARTASAVPDPGWRQANPGSERHR